MTETQKLSLRVDGASDPARRRFLHRLTASAGTVALGTSPLIAVAQGDESYEWRGQRRGIRQGRLYFPQSVASFEPQANSLIVWARLRDDDYAGQDLQVTLLVGAEPPGHLHRLLRAGRRRRSMGGQRH